MVLLSFLPAACSRWQRLTKESLGRLQLRSHIPVPHLCDIFELLNIWKGFEQFLGHVRISVSSQSEIASIAAAGSAELWFRKALARAAARGLLYGGDTGQRAEPGSCAYCARGVMRVCIPKIHCKRCKIGPRRTGQCLLVASKRNYPLSKSNWDSKTWQDFITPGLVRGRDAKY